MYRAITVFVTCSLICLLLAACGGDEEPTPAPEVATATVAPTVESSDAAEEEEAAEEEAAEEPAEEEAAEEEAPAEEAEASEEITTTEELTETADVTASETSTDTEEATSSEAMTETGEAEDSATVTETEEVTATTETTETTSAESTAAAEEEAPAEEEGSGTVTVESERPVTDIVGEKYAYFATVSPDGTMLAYAIEERRDRSLCVFSFENADTACYLVPEEFRNYPYNLYWSPDSTTLAFTENPIELGNESDIWFFDAATGEISNRTDDGVDGSYISAEQGTYALDYLPMWNEADGSLYFWRSVPSGELSMTLVLMRMDPAGGEPEEVRDLTTATGQQALLFDNENFYLDGVSALSPDGTKVAALVSSPLEPYESATNGLWVLDLISPDSEPQQLITMDQFQSAFAPFQTLPGVPVGLSWTADSSGLVAAAFSNDTHSPMMVFYYVDPNSGTYTPIVDFSGVPDLETLYSVPDEAGLPMRYYAPWTATISPAGDKLLMYNDLGGVPGMLVANLPPDGSKPVAVYRGEESTSGAGTRSSTSVDGKVIMYSMMFTVIE